MTLITSILLALLAIGNTIIARSLLYPPAIFTTLWATLLAGLFFAGNMFYPVSSETLVIFILGTIGFSLGGFLILFSNSKPTYSFLSLLNSNGRFINKFLNLSLLLLVLSFPFYIIKLLALSELSGIDNFLIGIRAQTSSGIKGELGIGIWEYVVSFASFISLAAFYEKNNSRWAVVRASLLIALALLYQLSTGGRTGAILILISLAGITFIRVRKVTIKTASVVILFLIVIFSVPAILLNKGASQDASFIDNASSIGENIQFYVLSSLVAFDRVVVESPPRSHGLLTFRFFINMANALGASIDLPSSVLEYTETPNPTNIYTIYYPYYIDFGKLGIFVIMIMLGAIITLVYKFAIYGRPEAIILYGLCFGDLMLTNSGEPFIVALSFWIQATLIYIVLYKLPRISLNKSNVKHRGASFS